MMTSMPNLFVYGSFMKGYMNNKHLKDYTEERALLPNYRKIWPRSKDNPVIIHELKSFVVGELYRNVSENTINQVKRLEGVPHLTTLKEVEIIVKNTNEKVKAIIFYPHEDKMHEWLKAKQKEEFNDNRILI